MGLAAPTHTQLAMPASRIFIRWRRSRRLHGDGRGRDFITGYATLIAAPVHTEHAVSSVRRAKDEYRVTTNQGEWRCDTVVVATGSFNVPHLPPCRTPCRRRSEP